MLFVSIFTSDRTRDPELWATIWQGNPPPSINLIGAYNLGNNMRVFIWEGESVADTQYMDRFNEIGVLEDLSGIRQERRLAAGVRQGHRHIQGENGSEGESGRVAGHVGSVGRFGDRPQNAGLKRAEPRRCESRRPAVGRGAGRGQLRMRIGPFIGTMGAAGTLEGQVQQVTDAESDGFESFWTPQISGVDALTMLALSGQNTQTIEVGTAVVPTYPRHPTALAQQALTTQAATGGRAFARNRPVAQTRRGGSLGNVVSITGAAHGGVPNDTPVSHGHGAAWTFEASISPCPAISSGCQTHHPRCASRRWGRGCCIWPDRVPEAP